MLRRTPGSDESLKVYIDDTGSSDTTFTDPAVEPNTQYVYRIKARNALGLSAESSFVNAETTGEPDDIPAAPTGLAVDSRTHNSITLSWDDPDDSLIQSYQVLRRPRDGSEYGDNQGAPGFVVIADNTGSTGAAYTDTSVTPSTRYVYSIKARNSAGLSAVSAVANAETPRDPQGLPTTPAGLAVDSRTHNSITLSWDDPDDSTIQSYQVLRFRYEGVVFGGDIAVSRFAVIADDTGSSDTTFTDTTVEPETWYAYRIRARDSVGLSPASVFVRAGTAAEPGIPATPTGLVVESRTHNSITLSWDDPDDSTIQSYQVLRRTSESDESLKVYIDDTGSSDTNFTDHTVEPNTQYVYRIKARNAAGLSAESSSVIVDATGEPTGIPAAPTGLAVDSRTHNSITLSWDDPDDSAIQSYQVIRRPRDGSVYGDNQGAPGFVVVADNTGSTGSTYTDTSVMPLTRYVYMIKARNAVGLSPVSASVNAGHTPTPTGLAVDSRTHNSITLSWDDPDDSTIRSYQVLRRTFGDIFFAVFVDDTGSSGATFTDSTVEPGTQYEYKIRARNAVGLSAESASFSVRTTEEPDGIPAAPTGLVAGSRTHNSITLSWDDPGDATIQSYQVLRRPRDGSLYGDNQDTPGLVVVADNTGSAGATYTDTSLTPRTRYVYRIKARNSVGLSPVSNFVNTETRRDPQGVPATPTGLVVDSRTQNSITLSWNDPDDSAIQSYQVLRRLASQTAFAVLVDDTGSSDTTFTDLSVQPNTRYVYRIRARDSVGLSPVSASLNAATAAEPDDVPAAPTGLAVDSRTHNSITLSWADPDDSIIQSYQVLRRRGNFTLSVIVDDTGSSVATFTDPTVEPDTRYTYSIRARNALGLSAQSAVVIAETTEEPDGIPAAPTGLAAGSRTHNSITLSWADPGDDTIQSYQVLRRPRDGSLYGDSQGARGFVVVADNTGSVGATYTDTSLTPNTRYVYSIKARNSVGLSPVSASVNTETPRDPQGVPATPTGLAVNSQTHNSITLSWNDPRDSAIQSYQVLRRLRDGDDLLKVYIDDTGSSDTTFTDHTVEPNTQYAYRIRARDSVGLSPISASANAETTGEPAGIPAAPAGLEVDSRTQNRITLSWDDPDDSAIQSYQVLRRPHDRSVYGDNQGALGFVVVADDTGSAGATYTDTSLTPNTRYVYMIKARNSVGLSPVSAPVSAETTEEPDEVPAAPTRLTVGSRTHNSITFSWDDPGGDSAIQSYQVLRRLASRTAFAVLVDDTGSSDTTFTDPTVQPETPYVYTIRARNSVGLSHASNFVNAETTGEPSGIPAAPTGLAAGSQTHNSVTLSWDDPGDNTIQSYQVLRRPRDRSVYGDNQGAPGFVVVADNTGSTGATYTDTSLTPNTRYVYSIRARNAVGLSAVSNFANAETPGDATLQNLTVGPENIIGFTSEQTNYAVGMSHRVTRATITAEPTDSEATVTYSVSDADTTAEGHQVDLQTGLNTFTITVTAEDNISSIQYALSIGRGTQDAGGWKAEDDLDGLNSAGNRDPYGIWSNGTTLWIVDTVDLKVYAYNSDGSREESKEFSLADANEAPTGIWSDGTIMWVADAVDRELYAYQLSDGSRVPNRDIAVLIGSANPAEIWSDGHTIWVLDSEVSRIFAYRLSDGERNASLDLRATSHHVPEDVPLTGLWMNEEHFWTADNYWDFLPARTLANSRWDNHRVVRLPQNIGLTDRRALWGEGNIIWVLSAVENKVYAFNIPRRDTSLDDLSVSPRNILGLSPDRNDYHLGVGRDVSAVTINATPADSGATINYSFDDADPDEEGHQVPLAHGLNTATVTVTAHSGIGARDYTLTIGRSDRSKYGWRAIFDLDGLAAEGNEEPAGIWGNESTFWVSNSSTSEIFAYNHDGSRDTSKELNFVENPSPTALWSDGTTMWVINPLQSKIFAYSVSNGRRDTSKEFTLHSDNDNPVDIWSDGTTMWVADLFPAKIFAYKLSDGERDTSKELDVGTHVRQADGMWSDGTTMWIMDRLSRTRLLAFNLEDKQRAPQMDFPIPTDIGIMRIRSLWSNGHTMWTIDGTNTKVYALNLLSSDSRLGDLRVDPRNIIGFRPERPSYAVGVSDEVTTVTITAGSADNTATVEYSVSDADPDLEGHQVSLNSGLNTVTLSVESEDETFTEDYTLEIGRGVQSPYGWRAEADLDGLIAAGNEDPTGIGGDASGLWVSDAADGRVYRYHFNGERNSSGDITLVEGNAHPAGFWSNESNLYVADANTGRLFAYGLQNGDHQSVLGIDLDFQNTSPRDVWSNGETVWVVDGQAAKIFAYLLSDGKRQPSSDIDVSTVVTTPTGIWSDGSTMWVAEDNSLAVTAWDLADGDPVTGEKFDLPMEIGLIEGKTLWAYGSTLWVTSGAKRKVYAVNLFSTDSTLSNLTVAPEDIIGFNPTIGSYRVGVAGTVTTATITATAAHSNATISFRLPDADPETEGHQVPLVPGLNHVPITVTAQDRVSTTGYSLLIGRGSEDAYGWKAVDDLDGLFAAGNLVPFGIWGNESTLWVVDRSTHKVYAYNRDGTGDSTKEFSLASDNSDATGIWSNGTTIWVADSADDKLYAYQLSDGARSSSNDTTLDSSNSTPGDIWSDGATMWVVDLEDAIIYGYTLADGSRESSKDLDVSSAHILPVGIWSDGDTMWVADDSSNTLLAWDLTNGDRLTAGDMDLPVSIGFADKRALWATGFTLWVTSQHQIKAYSFNLPNDDTSLSALTVSPRNIIGFTPGRFGYAVGMASSVTTATINATPTDENATVTYSFTDADAVADGRQISLNSGLNTVTVTVTAADGVSVQNYTLDIARGSTDNYGWKAVDDLDGLIAANNLTPFGLWSDGTSFYLADDGTDHVYVYNRDGTRDTSREITLDADDYHSDVTGIWSDGTTMWITNYTSDDNRMFAYRLSDGVRDPSKEFQLDVNNLNPTDIWSDNTTMWVVDTAQKNVFAYRLSDGAREPSKDIDISKAFLPFGIWSDGVTFWIGDIVQLNLLAWDAASGERAEDRDFQIPIETGLLNSVALWSDGTTMWVASANRSKVFSFNVPLSTEARFNASTFTVREGESVTVTVTLAPDPNREVTIPLSRTDLGDASADDYSGVPDSLVFLSGETTKSFTFNATDDVLDDDDESILLSFGTTPYKVSTGNPAEVTVVIEDNDDAPMLVLSVPSITVKEGDAQGASYTVKLATEPSENVTVTVTGHAGTDLSLDKETLTFTTSNYDTAQTVKVTAGQDDDGAGDTATLTHSAAGGNYADVSATLTVTIDDDDRGIVLTPATLSVGEDDAAGASYTVKLSKVPSDEVTVTVTGHAGTDLSLDKTTLTFTTGNWDTAQTVQVTVAQDDDDNDDTATLTHTAAGGDYDTLTANLPVTVVDDERGIVLTPTALNVGEDDAAGASYTVKLATEPSENVTVTVTGHSGTDLSLDKTTLTFTTGNWDTAQTVTVTAGHDDDYDYDTATLTHTAAGGEYDSMTADLPVTVVDDDRSIVLTPTTLNVGEDDTAGASYTVKLATEPSENVTVTVTGHSGTDLRLDKTTLTFTTGNWDTTQTVTVTAAQDDDDNDDTATLTHTAAGGDYDTLTADLPITVVDDDRGIVLTPTTLSVEEDDAEGASYTVKLATQPDEEVMVTVTGHAGTDLRLDTATLTFTTGNWDTAQTVTLTAAQDDDGTDDEETLTHTAAGGQYDSVTADLPVTVVDDDRSIVLSEVYFELAEGDTTGESYTVKLTTQPDDEVTVEVTGHSGTDLSLDKATLPFTTGNWDTAQAVTVTAAEDADVADDTVTLTHTATGGNYAGETADLPVTVVDDDRTIVLSPTSLEVDEGDAAGASYTVKLATQPSENVTVTVTGHSGTDLSLDKTTLTFTTGNWDTAQTVTVKAAQDDDGADDEETLRHTAAGGEYDSVTADLVVTVDDDRDIVLTPMTMNLREGDAMGASYTVKLSQLPSDEVTVTITGPADIGLALNEITLTFTTGNWDTAQTVTVTAVQDDNGADETATLTHTAAGGNYAGVTADLTVTVDDDETVSLVLSPTTLEVDEGDAAGGTYTVRLSHQPGQAVTVTVTGHSGTDLSLDKTTLTFTTGNWDTAQTVTVKAAQDDDGDDGEETLTHTAAGGNYAGMTADLPVTVVDDDRAIVLSATSITVGEGDATGVSYTAKLATQPSEDVTVAVTGHSGADLNLDKTTLTFTTSNWNAAQTVKVTAAHDADGADDAATLTHTATGGNYAGVTADLAVTVDDDETVSVVLSETALSVDEGDTTGADYTLKLSHQPSENVTVTVTGHSGTDLTLDKTTLTFTGGNWDTAQTVTVTARHDVDGDDDTATLTHTAAEGEYASVTATLPVTVVDDDRGIVLSRTSLSVDEGDTTGATYTVTLATQPNAEVTVAVSGHTGTDLSLDRASLTFTTGNWNTAQTVTVTAAQDDDGADDTATLTHTATGGNYTGETADLAVTVDDDETVSVVLSESALSVDEGGTTGADYTVRLSHQPSEQVTVTVSGQTGTDLTLTGLSGTSALTFTTGNWDTAQTVTVTAAHDDDGADDSETLTHTAAGGEYASVTADLPVTVVDDDRAIVLSRTSLSVDEGDTTGATYTVTLATQPSVEVTVAISGHTGTDVSVDKASLTFTTDNWDTAQTVTVTAGHDADGSDDTATLTHTATGGNYTGETADLAVTVDDDETVSLALTPTTLEVDEGDAEGGTYTVRLSHQPSEQVTVTVSGQTGTDLTLTGLSGTSALTFTASSWNTAQTVTVTAAHDDDGADDSETLTHTAAGGEYASVTADLPVTVVDDDRGIVLSRTSLSVGEGDAVGVSYTVKLATQPSQAVTVTVTGHSGSDLNLTGLSGTSTLTFTTGNWDTAQTVTVTAAQDTDGSDDTATLTHTATGGNYDGETATLAVTVDDDETVSVVLSETALRVDEGGTTGASYTVRLSHRPSEQVTVTVSGQTGTDLTLTGLSATDALTFTASSWNTAQTVTVTAAHDDDGADDTATLTHTAAGGNYAGMTAALPVTVVDDDRGIVLSPTSLEVDEGAAVGVSYTVKLATQPSQAVTVTVTGHSGSDLNLTGLSGTSTLTFTTGNWDTAQTVTVTAAQDADGSDDTATLIHTATGGNYTGETADLAVTVDDDETVSLALTPTILEVDEGDAEGGTYTVRLSHQPSENVTVTVTGHSGSDLTLTGLSATDALTFTASSWNTAQTVTVTAAHDDDGADDTATLTHTAAGGNYAGMTAALPVTVVDDDRGIVLSATSITVGEGDAAGAIYTVKLATQPSAQVTVTVTGHSGTDVSLDNASLTFTTGNWDTAQAVTVTAVEDADVADDTVTLTHTATGGNYAGETADLAVTVDDDETVSLTLTPTTLEVDEGDTTGADYTVRLSHQPSEQVTVTVSGQTGTDLTLTGLSGTSALTFTTSNWDTAQTVTVTAAQDDDGADDSETLTHTAAGGEYASVTAALPVTVVDDDRGIVLSPTSLEVDEGAAVGVSYTVKLATQPSQAVTVTVTGHSGSDLNLTGLSGTSTLTFTTGNWDTAQTVTVTAAQDADGSDDTATLTHTATGGNYAGVTATLAVTVDDDETVSVVLSESALSVDEGDTTGADYTVRLSHQPSENVTVTVTGHSGTDLSLDNASLTFTTGNWDTAQTVTVTARHDADGADDTVTLTHTAAGGEYASVTATLPVTVVDDDRGIVLSRTSLSVGEGDAVGVSYTVKLATQPSAEVTVTVTGQAGTDLTLTGLSGTSTLTFTTSNWNTAQTVTVTAGHDADGADDSVTLTHTATGGNYAGETADLTVTVNDDEKVSTGSVAVVVLSETALSVDEGDTTGADYTVRLSEQPSENVTVTVTGHAGTDLSLDKTTLTFTTSNWNTAQTVKVTAAHDDDGDDDTETLTHTAAGGEYDSVTATLPVTVVDDDRGIVLSPTSLEVDEGDATGATYTVNLATQPSAEVTVAISGHTGADLSLDKTTLTFTTGNWDTAQTVKVTAGHDDDGADDAVTLTHTATGGEYASVTAALPVTVVDDDRGIVLSATSITVGEGDAVGVSYTVKLATQPSGEVTVAVSGHTGTDVSVDKASLTFTTGNWNTAQTVKVTAAHDDDGSDDTATLTHTATGGNYTGETADLAVTVDDDETVSVVLSESALSVDEGDTTGADYTVRLSHQPSENVTVTVTGHSGTDLGLDKTTLTFTTSNWNTAQTVTVTAADDADGTDDSETLTHTAAGGEYASVAATLTVTVVDDDRGIVLSRTSLSVDEGDTTGATYTVTLATQPGAEVTVAISGHTDTDVSVDKASLTFTTDNWSTAQTVTVTAAQDADGSDDLVTLTHTAAGGEYASVTADLPVTVVDDDRGIVLSRTSLSVDEGDATGATYTVKLATQPSQAVTVTVSGQAGTDLSLTGLSGTSTLTFTTGNWDTAQTVTVTAAHDDDGADDTATLTHTAAGGNYAGETADLAVTVDDDETVSLTLTPTTLEVDEGGTTGADYTVRLSHQPSEQVTVTVSGQTGTDLTLTGLSGTSALTFTTSNWDTAQTVTVTAAQDDDGADDSETLTHTAAGGEYASVTAALPVTVVDDDRGIVLSRTSLSVGEGAAVGVSYTVKLATQPSQAVTVTVTGHSGSDLNLTGLSGTSTLTFTTGNWDTAQTVTVTAGHDADGSDDTATLTHTATGGNYAGVTATLPVTVDDDETVSVVLSESALSVDEGDTTGADYTVRLSHQPSENVTVTVTGHSGTDLSLDNASLTFTTGNWDTAQTVTVTARHDADGADDTVTLTHTAAGGEYASVTATLPVTVVDDDRGIVLSRTSLSVGEGDAVGVSYTVKLATQPSAEVTVTVTGHSGTDVSLDNASLTFTTGNWDTAQTVTVTAVEDADMADDSVTLTHTATGGNYAGETADLAVTVDDDETVSVVLSETALSVDEGDMTGADYTVRLSHQPSENITVTVTGHSGTDLSLTGLSGTSTLTFTTGNWNTVQTVTVTAAHDADGADDTVTLTHTAAGGEYASVTATLSVTVVDDDRQEQSEQPTASCDDLERYTEGDVDVDNAGKTLPDQSDYYLWGNTPLLMVNEPLEGYIDVCDDMDIFQIELEEGKYYRIDHLGSSTLDGTLARPFFAYFFIEDPDSNPSWPTPEPVWYRHSDGKRPFSVFRDGSLQSHETIWVDPGAERQDNWEPATDGNKRGGVGDNARQYLMTFPAGTYWVGVIGDGYTIGTYRMSLIEVSDDDSGIRSITLGIPATGSLDFVGDEDTFEVTLTAGTTYDINIDPIEGSGWEHTSAPRVNRVEDVAASTVHDYPLTTDGLMRSFTFTSATTGIHRFTVMGQTWVGPEFGDGEYRLTVAERIPVPSAPQNLTVSSLTHDSVTLTWEAPEDSVVESYQVLRRTRESGIYESTIFVAIADDTGSADTTYTDSSVEPTTSYVYRVKARNEGGLGERSNNANADTPAENSAATGAPTISGTAQVGQTLTADITGIADEDGLDDVSYSYQWLAGDMEIADATNASYMLGASDQGKSIKVRVDFTDDAGHQESLTSQPVGPVDH